MLKWDFYYSLIHSLQNRIRSLQHCDVTTFSTDVQEHSIDRHETSFWKFSEANALEFQEKLEDMFIGPSFKHYDSFILLFFIRYVIVLLKVLCEKNNKYENHTFRVFGNLNENEATYVSRRIACYSVVDILSFIIRNFI